MMSGGNVNIKIGVSETYNGQIKLYVTYPFSIYSIILLGAKMILMYITTV